MSPDYTPLLPYSMIESDAEIAALYAKLSSRSFADGERRLQFISEQFLGKPYLNGALGEGSEGAFDQSPLYRTDAFDCLTYVATVLALSFSQNLTSFKEALCDISYRNAEPRYDERHHFMSADWNVYNAERGYIEDVTQSVVDRFKKPVAKMAQTFVDRSNWMRYRSIMDIKHLKELSREGAEALLKELHDLSDTLVGEPVETAYLPLDQLLTKDKKPNEEIFKQIPSGVIVEIVRPNWGLRDKIGTNLNVSHLGFGFWSGDQYIFRHTSIEEKKVVEVVLADYLVWCLEKIDTVKGVNLQKVLLPG